LQTLRNKSLQRSFRLRLNT